METPVNSIFAEQFKFTFGSVVLNTEDITDEEALIFPAGDANCMNWLVGHIIDARNQLLALLKQQPVWDNEEFDCYARGANPRQLLELFLPFTRLIEHFKSSYERVVECIKNATSDQFDNIFTISSNDGITNSHTLLEWLTVFSFHESYHTGQTGMLRRVLGKEGKIK